MKNIFSLLLAFGLFGMLFTSCGGDPCEDEEQITEDAGELFSVALTYGLSPTDDNCKAYADALEDYLDKYDGCDGVDQSDIQESRDALNDLPCR